MALSDWIIDPEPVATATVATIATVNPLYSQKEQTVAVTTNEKAENNGQEGRGAAANVPEICSGCVQLEVLNIMGEDVPCCLYSKVGEYPGSRKRLPGGLKKCLSPAMRSPAKSEIQWASPGIHQREDNNWPTLSQHEPPCQPLRKKQHQRPSPIALAWLLEHLDALDKAGWTRAELYRRNKSKRGIAWLKLWDQKGVSVDILPDRVMVFSFPGTSGRIIRQTSRPVSFGAIK